MSVRRQRTPSHINRAIHAQAESRRPTAASERAAGHTAIFSVPVFHDPDATEIDFRAIASRGLWTEDNDWSLQWWWIATDGLFEV